MPIGIVHPQCLPAFKALIESSAFINLEDSDVTIEMERFLYEVARSYQECFRVYGSKKSFEWQQLSDEDPVLYERTGDIQQDMIDIDGDPDRFARGGEIIERRIKVPDYGYRLPEEIAFFTTETVYNDENEHLSFKQGGGQDRKSTRLNSSH